MTKVRPYDAAEYLDSPEMIATYLTGAFESEDPKLIARAIGNAARAQGASDLAEKIGLLGPDSKPEFATVLKVLHALGISLVAQTRAA